MATSSNYGSGHGDGGDGMVWKEETMYRWHYRFPVTSSRTCNATAAIKTNKELLRIPTQGAKFEFEQSVEIGDERFSWNAWAKWKIMNKGTRRRRFLIALQNINTNSKCKGKVATESNKPIPEERLSVEVQTTTGTKIFEGGPCNLSGDSWGGVIQGAYYYWTMIYITNRDLEEMNLRGGSMTISFILKTKISIVKDKEKFYRMITKLENDAENSDLKIISSDKKDFFAYRWILSGVSEVFETMFRSDMSESQSGVIKMDDLCATTVKALLHFIYTREVVVAKQWPIPDPDTLVELVYAAEKYQIKDLKNVLNAKLGMICSAENARYLRAMAKMTSLTKAAGDILGFLCENCKKLYRWEVNVIPFTKKDLTGMKRCQEVKFRCPTMEGVETRWKAQLNWDKYGGKTWIGLSLEQDGYTESAKVSVLIGNTLGTGFFLGEPSFVKRLTDSTTYHWADQQFSDDWRQALELNGGILVITFTMVHLPPLRDIIPTQIDKEKFYSMIGKLENDQENCDVKIISSDGKEFYAYRWILSEVSSVLKSRFKSDIKQTETGVVKFKDLGGATVKLLLHFIYTEEIGKDWSKPGIVEELMFAASKYEILKLKEYLDSSLGKICRYENATDLLSLARKYSMKKAVSDIKGFIGENCEEPQSGK